MHWVIVLLALDRSTLRIIENGVRDHLTSTGPSRHVVTDGFGELSLLMSLRMGLSVSQLAAQLRDVEIGSRRFFSLKLCGAQTSK